MFGLASRKKLRSRGVMGMNQRNVAFIAQYNDRKLYPNVDNKLKTKRLAQRHGIAVPELLGEVEIQHGVEEIFATLSEHQGFCIKPAKGSGGKGILVVTKIDDDGFHKASGELVDHDYIVRHISNILAGLFSLGGSPDVAMLEALIRFDPVFDGLSHQGVPDIRLIVFQGYPVMAMLRLATLASDGKANLHQGAVGVGIDIKTGAAVAAVQHNQIVTHHPDTGRDLSEIKVADWRALLELSASCYEMSGLGYLGVDIVLDKNRGPLVLELNARPGLAIQIANQMGLLSRLREIENLDRVRPPNCNERVDYVLRHF